MEWSPDREPNSRSTRLDAPRFRCRRWIRNVFASRMRREEPLMYGKRLTLPLGAALLAALTFGPGQAPQASAASGTHKAVVSTATTNIAQPPPGPDHGRDRYGRGHDRYG